MQVRCASCGRTFDVDPDRIEGVNRAMCECGTAIVLRTGAVDSSFPRPFGKYVLIERLATGGMGEIYFAKIAGVEGFERHVVIKKLLPNLSKDQSFVQMLVKEAKLTVRLQHPNVVQVFDLAREGDELYIAMEYIPGVDLSTLLAHCREKGVALPVSVCIAITVQALRGLAYAHELKDNEGQPGKVIHRDFTPHNIMVTHEGWAKVMDFGIAKARNEISTTNPGTLKGKLGYFAPEQLFGDEIDQRVDVFCAGIVLWESLSGERLFKGDSEIATLKAMADAKIPPLAFFRDDVPASVEAALRTALAQKASERTPTATAFADALSEAMAPLSTEAMIGQARTFFAEQTGLFSKTRDQHVMASDMFTAVKQGTGSLEKISTITDFVRSPIPAPSRRPLAAVISVIGVIALVGVAAGIGWSRMTAPSQEAATSRLPSVSALVETTVAPGPAPREATPHLPENPEPKHVQPAEKTGPLTASEIQSTVHGYSQSILRCVREVSGDTPSQVNAKLTIERTGKVSEVVLTPPIGVESLSSCLERTLLKMRFRKHSGNALEVIVPLKIQAI